MKHKAAYIVLILLIILGAVNPGEPAIAVVDLLYFFATPGTISILLTWETATEFDNIGFYVQRGFTASGPFAPISPRIISIGDPLVGHLYEYEDVAVEIGEQYYYVLEILNADGTSEFTAPVGAIIPAPTATPTITPTRTATSFPSPSLTPTGTSTFVSVPTRTATPVTLTPTPEPTTTPTSTITLTPTTTLQLLSSEGIGFPAQTPTVSNISPTAALFSSATSVHDSRDTLTHPSGVSVQSILVLTILLWLAIAVFLFFFIRHISHE